MAVWDELKVVLVRLRDEQPRALLGYPMPEVDEGRLPPFNIRLAAWASATAEDLYRQFGDDVDLTVGALPYPAGRQPPRRPPPGEPPELLDPHDMSAELDGPAVVRSGETLSHGLLLTNLMSLAGLHQADSVPGGRRRVSTVSACVLSTSVRACPCR